MYRKRTLYVLALFLVLEGLVIAIIPSRLPLAARAITAGVNLVAAAAVVLLVRQRK
jgi:hypothetical protein